jgi:U3 small nucleolar ribonucleoprotein component
VGILILFFDVEEHEKQTLAMQTISHKGPDAEDDKLRCLRDTNAHSRRTGWAPLDAAK